MGYSPWSCKEFNMAEHTHTHTHTSTHTHTQTLHGTWAYFVCAPEVFTPASKLTVTTASPNL